MAWVTPTAFNDPDSAWNDENNIKDDNTSSYGFTVVPQFQWSKFIELTHSAIVCNQVRIWADLSVGHIETVDIDVYYGGAWHHVYQGAFTDLNWTTKSLGGSYSLTAIRCAFDNSGPEDAGAKLYEVDFGQLDLPAQVTNVQATDGTYTDKVRVTWNAASGADKYYVWNGSSWIDVGLVTTWDHTGAPAPTITPGTASASDGTSADHVTLSISGESANNGSSISYKVKAWNAAGYGAESASNSGYRGVGTLTYQWQRSAGDSDADYSNIDGATTASYNDTGAPSDGSGRYYRCVINATGATQQISTSDRGYRIAPQYLNSIATISVSTIGILSRGITGVLSSTASITSSITGRLTRIVNLASTSAIVTSITGKLSRILSLASTANIVSSITGRITKIIQIASTANITTSISSVLTAIYTWIKVTKEVGDFTKVDKEKDDWTRVDREEEDWDREDKE